jgi:hypothetical protein
MRVASRLFASLTLVFAISLPLATAAQQPNNKPPACEGKYNIVRVSEIKPGMMDKFLQAIAAQAAWYKKAGRSDEIVFMRLIDTKEGTYSTTQALTSHISTPSSGPRLPHDAGYDAFVALFRESSDIKYEYFTCMEKEK